MNIVKTRRRRRYIALVAIILLIIVMTGFVFAAIEETNNQSVKITQSEAESFSEALNQLHSENQKQTDTETTSVLETTKENTESIPVDESQAPAVTETETEPVKEVEVKPIYVPSTTVDSGFVYQNIGFTNLPSGVSGKSVERFIYTECQKYGMPSRFMLGNIRGESVFNNKAYHINGNHTIDVGLCQINSCNFSWENSALAKQYGYDKYDVTYIEGYAVNNIWFNPYFNLTVGISMLGSKYQQAKSYSNPAWLYNTELRYGKNYYDTKWSYNKNTKKWEQVTIALDCYGTGAMFTDEEMYASMALIAYWRPAAAETMWANSEFMIGSSYNKVVYSRNYK